MRNKILLPFEYDQISNWVENGPRHSNYIVKNGKTGLIDESTFKITVPPIYDSFEYLGGLIFVKRENKAGIIAESGKIICPLIFDEIYPSFLDIYDYKATEKRIFAKRGKHYFQIDEKGNILKSNISLPDVLMNTVIPEPPPPKRPK